MAGFKTHITFSSMLGVGYTGAGLAMGLPLESSLIAGGLCGVGGMLPDIDSDSGVPFRESMCFAAAIIPILLLDELRAAGLNYEQLVLVCGSLYLFVRFGVGRLLARYTVHRGMFHSVPAALTFAGVAFLISGCNDLQLRYFKAAGIFLGVMSHLLLDEIYSIEWHRGRWRFKKSFGTAMKLWGKNRWANVSTYGKLIIVALMILGEPMVMERYGQNYGQLSKVVIQRDQWRPGTATDQQIVQTDPGGSAPPVGPPPLDNSAVPQSWYPPGAEPPAAAQQPQPDRTIYDTARRFLQSLRGEQKQR
ncbi:MAG: metal-dependent hydrolase [Bythopirellula sp.]